MPEEPPPLPIVRPGPAKTLLPLPAPVGGAVAADEEEDEGWEKILANPAMRLAPPPPPPDPPLATVPVELEVEVEVDHSPADNDTGDAAACAYM